MNTDAEKVQRARQLITEKRYDEARVLLQTIDHPTARDWLAKLDQMAAQSQPSQPSFGNSFAQPPNAAAPPYGAPQQYGAAPQYGAPQYGAGQPQPYGGYNNMPGALPANVPISDD